MNLEPALAEAVKLRAREKRRSTAKHIQTLIEEDLRQAQSEGSQLRAAEDPEAYTPALGVKPLSVELAQLSKAAQARAARAAASRAVHK